MSEGLFSRIFQPTSKAQDVASKWEQHGLAQAMRLPVRDPDELLRLHKIYREEAWRRSGGDSKSFTDKRMLVEQILKEVHGITPPSDGWRPAGMTDLEHIKAVEAERNKALLENEMTRLRNRSGAR